MTELCYVCVNFPPIYCFGATPRSQVLCILGRVQEQSGLADHGHVLPAECVRSLFVLHVHFLLR